MGGALASTLGAAAMSASIVALRAAQPARQMRRDARPLLSFNQNNPARMILSPNQFGEGGIIRRTVALVDQDTGSEINMHYLKYHKNIPWYIIGALGKYVLDLAS